MKKQYYKPTNRVVTIISHGHLMNTSAPLGPDEPVGAKEDIDFDEDN
ncbi:MAG: hypothetical protein Q4F34_03145 [Prevotellaceae bacterium]|nr:hypothetical protein [Prevotellaceae bacterium]